MRVHIKSNQFLWRPLTACCILLCLLCGCAAKPGGSRTDTGGAAETVKETEHSETDDNNFPVYRDTFVFGRPEAPAVFDPVLAEDTATTRLFHSLIPGLVQVDAEGKIVPDLAESWEKSADDRTWIFHLQPGLRFADGSEVTIEDWKFTFERARDTENSYWRFAAADIETISGTDDTLILTLSQARPAFLASLTLFNMGLQSKAHFDSLGGSYEDGWPLGAGAYRISRREQDETVVLEANPYYYKEGYPKTLHIRIETIPEDSDRLMLLETGQLDLMSDVPYFGASYTNLTEGLRVEEFPSTLCRYLVMNGEANPALADPEVRTALMMATDFGELIDRCLYGYGIRTNSFLSPATPGYDETLKPYKYDPAAARKVLEGKGYGDGLLIRLYLRKGLVLFEEIGVSLQEQWKKAGVQVEIIPMNADELRERQKNMDLDMVIGSWTEDIPDPSGFMEYLLDQEHTRGFYTSWHSEDAEALFAAAKYEPDDQKRAGMYNEIQRIVHDEAALPALFCSNEIVAIRDETEGYLQTPYGQYILEAVTVRIDTDEERRE